MFQCCPLSDSLSDAAQKFNLLCGVGPYKIEVLRRAAVFFETYSYVAGNQQGLSEPKNFLQATKTDLFWERREQPGTRPMIRSSPHTSIPMLVSHCVTHRTASREPHKGLPLDCGPPLSCARASAIDRTARNTKVRGNRRERERERERGQWQAIATITVLRWRAENAQPALACLLTRASGRVPAYLFA